ncbi:hypothetical protein HK102_013903 [Quaeritorhiza haematococci]|nr:hypothetical protein HK102_013903 [Quaeritorhiza haematococci]
MARKNSTGSSSSSKKKSGGGKKNDPALGMGAKFGRPDLDRLGVFSELSYLSNEPYRPSKDKFLTERAKGKQFSTHPPHRGHHTHDVYFQKEFTRLFENEAYTDLVQLRRNMRITQKEANIVNNPFRPSNVAPKPSGMGSWFGTIEQQFPLFPRDSDRDNGNDDDDEGAGGGGGKPLTALVDGSRGKPNFLIKPPKKGSGYGYANLTIGASYEYMSDPYQRRYELIKEQREDSKKKVTGDKPFVSSIAPQHAFNQFLALDFTTPKAPPTSKKLSRNDRNNLPSVPWRPSSYLNDTINKYPSHESESSSNKKKGSGQSGLFGIDLDDDNKGKIGGPIFKPSGVSKSYPSRSIIQAKCPLMPPKWLQESIAVLRAES